MSTNLRGFDFIGMERGWRICISNKSPCEAAAPDLGDTLGELQSSFWKGHDSVHLCLLNLEGSTWHMWVFRKWLLSEFMCLVLEKQSLDILAVCVKYARIGAVAWESILQLRAWAPWQKPWHTFRKLGGWCQYIDTIIRSQWYLLLEGTGIHTDSKLTDDDSNTQMTGCLRVVPNLMKLSVLLDKMGSWEVQK